MTDAEIWAQLGIAPTLDQDAIRRAYAERLKQTRPDTDPAGFRLLREAFETARNGVPSRPGPPLGPPLGPPMPAPLPVPRPASPAAVRPLRPSVPPPLGPSQRASLAIRTLLQSGQLLDAARAWHDATAAGELDFDDQSTLQAAIAAAMLARKDADLAMLDAAARQTQWPAAAREMGAAQPVLDILERRAAETWLAELNIAAQAPWSWSGARRRRNRAARILLRPAPGPLRQRFPYVFSFHDLGYWLPAAARHRRFLRGRLDDQRIVWCRAATTRPDARLITAFWRLNLRCAFIPFSLVAHILAWIF